MLSTGQNRYMNQVHDLHITPEMEQKLRNRLATRLRPDETVQVDSSIRFMNTRGEDLFGATGRSDVSREDEIWELKFVSELSHVHHLQLAMYLIGERKSQGLLWNVRTGELHRVTIPNRELFLDAVGKAATKGRYRKTKRAIG